MNIIPMLIHAASGRHDPLRTDDGAAAPHFIFE